MTRGVVIFGVNNSKVDYGQLAMISAMFVKKNMPGTRTCLITDSGTLAFQKSKPKQFSFDTCFDEIVVMPNTKEVFENSRTYRDTQYYSVKERFRNETRSSVYDLSPYDETILIDCDYLVCNNSLSSLWGNVEDVLMNRRAIGLMHNHLRGPEERLNPFGIPMYWATVIFFRKGKKAKELFDLVAHVKENWEFYKHTYDFPGSLFRNDYAFSIAAHMLNGFAEGDAIKSLPEPSILTALDIDQFYKIASPTELRFFAQDQKQTWKYYGVRTESLNVHCMNKLSLLNAADEIMEVLR